MSSLSPDARFFGVDLTSLWREVKRPWLRMHQWAVFAWLTPSAPVRLLRADGGESYWLGDTRQSGLVGTKQVRFTAIELPEDFVLRPHVVIPVMGAADTANALGLQVRSISPFPVQDLVWGYRAYLAPGGVHQVDVALVSRKQIEAYLVAQSERLQGLGSPEVWVCAEGRPPIVLGGYGESKRAASARHLRNVGYGLLVSAILLSAAIGLTPTIQLWLRAREAVEVYGATVQRTKSLVRQRELLLQSVEKLGSLSAVLAGRIEPLRVLDKLTQTLPDDTSVQTFSLKGSTVSMTGLTANAATLMQLLGEQRGLRDVRAPSAATRVIGASREAFVIMFSLDPQLFGVVGGADPITLGPQAPASAVAANASLPVAVASSASSLMPAVPAVPIVPIAPRSSAGAGSGGVATFGGGATRPFVAPPMSPASSTSSPGARVTP